MMNKDKPGLPSTLDPLFDIEKLRISADYAATLGATKVITMVPVRKPDRQVFIRVHPDEHYQLPTLVLELREDRETYLVHPELRDLINQELVTTLLYTAITRQGNIFLWAVRMPGIDGRLDPWNQSAHEAAQHGMKKWIRVQSNRQLGCYEIYEAAGEIPEPEWPEKTMEELLRLAFKNRFVTSLDHPILQQLRGQ